MTRSQAIELAPKQGQVFTIVTLCVAFFWCMLGISSEMGGELDVRALPLPPGARDISFIDAHSWNHSGTTLYSQDGVAFLIDPTADEQKQPTWQRITDFYTSQLSAAGWVPCETNHHCRGPYLPTDITIDDNVVMFRKLTDFNDAGPWMMLRFPPQHDLAQGVHVHELGIGAIPEHTLLTRVRSWFWTTFTAPQIFQSINSCLS